MRTEPSWSAKTARTGSCDTSTRSMPGSRCCCHPTAAMSPATGGSRARAPAWISPATTAVLDLTTGQVRTYDAGQPLAWSPDGHSLLARSGSGNLSVVDVDAQVVVDLDLYGGEPTSPTWVVFSPDGRRAALQVGRIRASRRPCREDVASGSPTSVIGVSSPARVRGPSTAGSRSGTSSSAEPRADRPESFGFELSYVDAELGIDVEGPRLPPIHGWQARLLGWQSDGDAVVVLDRNAGPLDPILEHGMPTDVPTWQATAQPEVDQTPEVLALRPGGGSITLVTLPRNANRVDIAVDLLDRSGGSPASLQSRILDWLGTRIDELLVLVAVAAAIVGGVLLCRRTRTGFWRYPRRR